MFINLSNHPSSIFGYEQLMAAKSFGEIIDVPFPPIPPLSDNEYIDYQVDKYYNKILNIVTNKDQDVVHLMGEMVFTFRLVNRLAESGIRCIASTTERREDGTFCFACFRDYLSHF